MESFIQLINDIADRVNLLSLNASIEAARLATMEEALLLLLMKYRNSRSRQLKMQNQLRK
jgi:hypothetical protein